MYDPAWDMPRIGWRQQGSYEQGEIPPSSEPDGGTLVCLPPINQDWLPFILGCVDQMRNPSSWIVADDDAMYATLVRVDRLKQMLGGRGACFMYTLRFTDGCVLQFSVDGGATWADVTGWGVNFPACVPPQTSIRFRDDCLLENSGDGGATWTTVNGWAEFFGNCVRENAPIVGLPPNPGGQDRLQLACSIASYLAEQVVIGAMGKAVTAVSDDLTLLNFGLDVLTLIPEFVLVAIAADAFAAIYVAVQEGTLSDFEAALTDATLLGDLICTIFTCISTDGYVKPSNFACIVTAVGAISYAHSDVISAIVSYLDALGAVGLAQLSQVAGLGTGLGCSGCTGGGWCYEWIGAVDQGDISGWNFTDTYGVTLGSYVPGLGFQSFTQGAGNTEQLTMHWSFGFSTYITNIYLEYETGSTAGPGVRQATFDAAYGGLNTGMGSFSTVVNVEGSSANVYLELDSALTGIGTHNVISRIRITGTGTSPFPASNC